MVCVACSSEEKKIQMRIWGYKVMGKENVERNLKRQLMKEIHIQDDDNYVVVM
jgi:hypothetical protein